jgi:hypothetical protein
MRLFHGIRLLTEKCSMVFSDYPMGRHVGSLISDLDKRLEAKIGEMGERIPTTPSIIHLLKGKKVTSLEWIFQQVMGVTSPPMSWSKAGRIMSKLPSKMGSSWELLKDIGREILLGPPMKQLPSMLKFYQTIILDR